MDKGCGADICDCQLTLEAWTAAELIKLMSGVGRVLQGAMLWEEKRGQDGLTSLRISGK